MGIYVTQYCVSIALLTNSQYQKEYKKQNKYSYCVLENVTDVFPGSWRTELIDGVFVRADNRAEPCFLQMFFVCVM